MKKTFYWCFSIVFVFALCILSVHAAYSPVEGDGYLEFDYSSVGKGIVNGYDTAFFEKNVYFEGRNAAKITPNPESELYSDRKISLDCFGLGSYSPKIEFDKYNYVGITYYYDTDNPVDDASVELRYVAPITLDFEPVYETVSGKWTEVYFKALDVEAPEGEVTYLKQFHIYPFGSTKTMDLSRNDVFYIEKVTFYEDCPTPDIASRIIFDKAVPDAKGENIELSVDDRATYVLPENPFEYVNADFLGWQDYETGELYQPGDEFTSDGRDRHFLAKWSVFKLCPDAMVLDYREYSNGIVDSRDSGYYEEVIFDGRRAVKVMPNPNHSVSRSLVLDGFKYENSYIDFWQYNYATVEYYYKSENPVTSKMKLAFYDDDLLPDKSASTTTGDSFKTGCWDYLTFDLSPYQQKHDKTVKPARLRQIHIYVFGSEKVQNLNASDELYISKIMFFKEKPTFESVTPYINGYDNYTFKPGEALTGAQACAMVARVCAKEPFDSVAESGKPWYSEYVDYCKENGFLDEAGQAFDPTEYITRKDFSTLVFNAAKKAAETGSVAAEAITLSEANNSDDDMFITREQAVSVINRAFKKNRTKGISSEELYMLYLDVDFNSTFFADIALATVPHIEYTAGGKTNWLYALEKPVEKITEEYGTDVFYNTSAGNQKIAEYDIVEKQRIEEIRSTPSMSLSHITGKILYVSESDGSDDNDGLSPDTPLKTPQKARVLSTRGDAVLFKRGDLWRTKFSAKAGVTYSAYGEGDKPVFSGSPEDGADPDKWFLVHEDTETGALIWQYANSDILSDVGTIVFNGGEGYAQRSFPSCIGDKFYVRNTSDVLYDYREQLSFNLNFVHLANSSLATSGGIEVINLDFARGPLYLRCDNGNPGKVFESIEFCTRGNVISGAVDTVFDNLCVQYGGSHGIGCGTVGDIVFTNCEIRWIGGSMQKYDVRSGVGFAAPFGNGIEVYGGCDSYLIENCLVYQCYDAGITHQFSGASAGECFEDNVTYRNNVITDCVYNIEYFLSAEKDKPLTARRGKNILFEGNLLRRAGFGFGSHRPDLYNQRCIRSGTSRNEFENFVIRNNVLDRAVQELAQTFTSYEATAPKYEGNVYIQGVGNGLFHHSTGITKPADFFAQYNIQTILGDSQGIFYFTENIPLYAFSYDPGVYAEVTESDRVAK